MMEVPLSVNGVLFLWFGYIHVLIFLRIEAVVVNEILVIPYGIPVWKTVKTSLFPGVVGSRGIIAAKRMNDGQCFLHGKQKTLVRRHIQAGLIQQLGSEIDGAHLPFLLRSGSVSYTHLDVYKRQIQDGEGRGCI